MNSSFFRWLDQLTYSISQVWTWLITPLVSSNNDVLKYASTPIAILTMTTILAVLVARIIHVFNPLS